MSVVFMHRGVIGGGRQETYILQEDFERDLCIERLLL